MDNHHEAAGISHLPLLHIANILYLASYSVRDIFWLRILTVLAMLCLSHCYIIASEYGALGWQGAFLLINFFQIGLLVYERRPVKLTEDQKALHEGPLKSMSPRQVQRFTDMASWHTVQDGATLIYENQQLDFLVLILSGEAKVLSKGEEIARIHTRQFAGEMSFLTEGNATASVIADGTVLYAKWPREYINELMERDHELGTALQATLGSDLVSKILQGREPDTDTLH
ncbi:MAG: cyclic nucleotide-binding domain-containing protein [Planctomycetota bacterium]